MVAVEKRYGECTPRNLGPGSGFAHSRSGQQHPRIERRADHETHDSWRSFADRTGRGNDVCEDSYRRERDIRRDEAKIAHDRWELRRDLYYGNYAAARHERRELQREYRDLDRDYRDLNRERRDYYWDRR